MSDRSKLDVRLAPEAVSGISTMEIHIPQALSDHYVEVFYANQSSRFAVGATGTKAIRMHTHLLRNGRNRLLVLLRNPNNDIVTNRTPELTVCNTGPLAEAVRDSLVASETPFLFDGPCDSSLYDYADESLFPWYDRSDALTRLDQYAADGEVTGAERSILSSFVSDGFVILPNAIEPSLIDAVNLEIDDAIKSNFQGYQLGSSQRIEKLHEHYTAIRTLWTHPDVTSFVRKIFRSEPRHCQTLTYVFGSQQDAHQDTVHLTSFPAGYMCGVWIALEDVLPGSGELEVFKGSHRLPRLRMKECGAEKVAGDWSEFGEKVVTRWTEMLSASQFEKIVYRAKKGSVLIWHENLMHGGSLRQDMALSRRSIVSHMFGNGAISYYDSTGMPGHQEPLDNSKYNRRMGFRLPRLSNLRRVIRRATA